MKLLSIIVPFFNVESYIRQCLVSLTSNCHKNIEIIVVNDGSTDDSYNQIADIISKDNRIIYIEKQNGGLSSARNVGLKSCSGQYIAFVDSDDWVDKDYFEKILNNISTNTDIIVFGYYHNIVERNTEERILLNQVKSDDVSIILPIIDKDGYAFNLAWNKVYRREVIEKHCFQLMPYIEDLVFNCEVFLNAQKVTITNDLYYHYRTREQSLSHRSFYRNYHEYANKAIESRKTLYCNKGIAETEKALLLKKELEYRVGEIANTYRENSTFTKSERLEALNKIKYALRTINYGDTHINKKSMLLANIVKYVDCRLSDVILQCLFTFYR